MEPAILGLVLDSSVLIAAERRKQTPTQIIEDVAKTVGAVPIIISWLTVAAIGHGIYRMIFPLPGPCTTHSPRLPRLAKVALVEGRL